MPNQRAFAAILGFATGFAACASWYYFDPPPRYRPGGRVTLVSLGVNADGTPWDVPIDVGRVGTDHRTAAGAEGTIIGRFSEPWGSLLGPRFWVRLDGVDTPVIAHQNNLCDSPPGRSPRSASPVIYRPEF